ncbi:MULTISPECIES: hypothetical protein [Streptomyces violaceusniger group]|uniref:Membrane protein n=1 Tax=Streptomyces rhizosphaericus TaxID=114699 RepID=A0ABN1SET9_9ACTN|nr:MULTISPECIES: hypothetical protein [Streptomyces violaceusniger group]
MAVEQAENATTAEGQHPHGHPHGHKGCECPQGAREGHRRAVATFVALRERFAAGEGLPRALAHSAGASRQWVSDELAHAARSVADSGRAETSAWRHRVWLRTVCVVWGAAGALLIGQLATAIGAGWSVARTAGLTAAVITAALLTLTARLHRADGGPLAPLVGEDNRLSTSRTVAAAWLLIAVFAVLVLGVELAVAPGDRQRLTDGLALGHTAGLLTVAASTCVAAVLARLVVAARVRAQRLQKVRAVRPRAADLLTDDAGRGSFADVQYIVVHTVALAFTAVRLAREPWRLPDVPWGLALLAAVSVVMYLTGKYAEGGRPTVLSVVRALPEEGAIDRDAPIRTGDDIEIRGSGFVPPGAQDPDRLAKLVVRIGAVHVHVPLVPVAGGFSSPTDTALTVPVPVDVEPGRVDVQVVTASGAETNRYPIDVMD